MADSSRHWNVTLTPLRILVVAATVLVLAGAGIATAVLISGKAASSGKASGTTTSLPPASSTSTSTTSTQPPAPIHVTSYSPQRGRTGVKGTSRIIVTFSAPIAPGSPMPSLSPSEPGNWTVGGSGHRSVVFVPALPYLPLTAVTLFVPAGTKGIRAVDGAHMERRLVDKFRIADGSTSRLQQLLSQLDYSPLAFKPAARPIAATDTTAQRSALFFPPRGTFVWRNGGWPHQLRMLWEPGAYGVMTKGLVMEFEADHGLFTNGTTSTALWRALLTALASREVNTGGYNYALGDQSQPESLTIWHDGAVVLHAPANTGISQAPTVDGNFPVFGRFRNQVMRGRNPSGSKYADPVQYVAYFNGGDAVHYIPRSSYGIPQSLGCIELDLGDAAKAWPYLAYGTIVTVIN